MILMYDQPRNRAKVAHVRGHDAVTHFQGRCANQQVSSANDASCASQLGVNSSRTLSNLRRHGIDRDGQQEIIHELSTP